MVRPEKGIKCFLECLFLLLVCVPIHAQETDSIPRAANEVNIQVSPRRAILLAAALPGAGQAYNKKYWKIPIVYVGFGAFSYSIYFNSTHYIQYKQALIDFQDKDPNTVSYLDLIGPNTDPGSFDPMHPSANYSSGNADWFKKQLEDNMNYYKRYRDLTVLMTVGFYALTIVDAAVDAFLADYDISDDLSMKIQPELFSLPGQMNILGLKCSLNF